MVSATNIPADQILLASICVALLIRVEEWNHHRHRHRHRDSNPEPYQSRWKIPVSPTATADVAILINAAKEIEGVIKALTQGNPKKQEATLSRYFLQNASFSHPYCHVPSFSKGLIPFSKGLDSRWVLLAIYRWYRILSPHIDIKIDSVG